MTAGRHPQYTDIVGSVDAVTFEVIRHRLLAITDEQSATLAAISGSPHVTNANDFNVGLYLPNGDAAAMGRTILWHSASMSLMTRHVIEDCSEDPGIAPGDMFVVNHPWKGSIHAQDMGIIAPIFYQGQLLAWTGAMCHLPDVGGTRPGSFCSDATESYQEGLQVPPTKLVDGGRIRSDIWQLLLAHTRAAPAVNLDLRGLVGANNTAVRAMTDLAERYGPDTVLEVMTGLIDLSDRRLRSRLAELPDAVVRSRAYLDNDGGLGAVQGLYEVDLVLTKRGSELVFDYSGSSPQAEGYINCTYSGLMAGVSAALLPTLGYDAPWNQGLFRAVEVRCPEGRICNARHPAAVSGGALESGWLVEITAVEALSKLAACSDELVREAQAAPAGGPDQFVVSGLGPGRSSFTHVILDCLATGGGAYAHRDGVWTQGQHNIERQRISNVESMELDTPFLYLWRGLVTDSGGAGRHRGGQSIGATYVLHRGENIRASCNGHGWEVPNSVGIFGGYPGTENDRELVTGSDVWDRLASGELPRTASQLLGERPVMRGRQGVFPLQPGDVLTNAHQAGGGWGDPLSRPVEAVAEDLAHRAVGHEAANRLYGVVVADDGTVDVEATVRLRDELRAARKSWQVNRPGPSVDGDRLLRRGPLGDVLEVASDQHGQAYVRCACGHVLSRLEDSWRPGAAWDSSARIDEISRGRRLHADLELRRYACPGCGVLLATDVVRRGNDHLHDVEFLT